MSFERIVTHPGGAHKDDFLACCVLLPSSPVPIERRDPEPCDLESPDVAVVDVGSLHEPENGNFDHHQFPRDHVPTCALSLVLQHLGLYEDARLHCDWLETSEWLDCRGPVHTARWLGIGPDVMGKLNSPVDITLLRRFAAQPNHLPGEPVWEVMRMIGMDMVDFISRLRERMAFVAQHAELWQLDGFRALYMPRTEPLPEDASAGLARYIEQTHPGQEVIAMVYPDGRGTGYGLRRHQDDPRLDFTRIGREDDVHFTHQQGFIAKCSATEKVRLRELLQQAYVPV